MGDLRQSLSDLLAALRTEKRRDHRRTVSVGDLLSDRWERAAHEGWGEGSSCYDNVLVLGHVHVGEHTWVGPNCVLDGSGGGLRIGSHCAISAGVQIYTHDVVERTTSRFAQPIATAPTVIGSGVFIGPNSVVARGVTIGDGAVVGALSFVNSDVAPGQRVWGSPARPSSSS